MRVTRIKGIVKEQDNRLESIYVNQQTVAEDQVDLRVGQAGIRDDVTGIREEVVRSRNKIIASNKEKAVGKPDYSSLHKIQGGARQQESVYVSPQGASMVQGYQTVPVVQHHQTGSLRRMNSLRGVVRNRGGVQNMYTSSPVIQAQGAVGGYSMPVLAMQGMGGGYHQGAMTQGVSGLTGHPQESEPVYIEAGESENYIQNENFY